MKALKYIGLVIVLTIIGFYSAYYFIDFSCAQLNNGDIQIVSYTLGGNFFAQVVFSFSIGILPLLYLVVERVARIKFLYQGLITIGIIISYGILLWQVNIFQMNQVFHKIAKLYQKEGKQITISLEELKFGQYLFTGFILGAIISIIIFRWIVKGKVNTVES